MQSGLIIKEPIIYGPVESIRIIRFRAQSVNIFHLDDNWPKLDTSKEPFNFINNASKKSLLLI